MVRSQGSRFPKSLLAPPLGLNGITKEQSQYYAIPRFHSSHCVAKRLSVITKEWIQTDHVFASLKDRPTNSHRVR